MSNITIINISFRRPLLLAACLAACAWNGLSAADASAEKPMQTNASEPAKKDTPPSDNCEQKCGIKVTGIFLSGGGNLVDFRYKVLDPAKAATLTKIENKPALLDQTTGAKLRVPETPKVGPLRQTSRQPVAGKVYFMLFANTQHHVKKGDKITITAGDFKVENLEVE